MASFFSRLNPVPTFPPLTGPHNVGTVDIELDASELQDESSTFTPVPTIAFRCFYPCETPTKPASPAYWVQSPQRDIISAYCRFVGAGSALSNIIAYFSQLLYRVQIPAHRNATLLPPTSEKGKWPVMIFSHGLGGSRNSYSYICSSLASHGIFVVAAEHRDGSAPISHVRATSTTPATTVDYQRYSHTPSSEVYNGRDEMLKTRIWEVALIQQALQKIEAGTDFRETDTESAKQDKHSSKDLLGTFQNRLAIAKPGSISFAGHSFGAATVVQYVKSLFYYSQDKVATKESSLLAFKPTQNVLNQITRTTPSILLDLWALPLNSPNQHINKLPMPYYTSTVAESSPQTPTPILAILSRAFVNWTGNFNDVKRHLAEPKPSISAHLQPALLFYPTASAHLSQSDFGVLFPRVTKYFANADEPERTLELNVRAILQMLRKRGVDVAGTQDEEILSTKEGTVRGWTAIGADEAAPGKLEEVQVHERPNGLARSQTSESKGGQIAEAQVVMNGEISGAREQAVQG